MSLSFENRRVVRSLQVCDYKCANLQLEDLAQEHLFHLFQV